MELTQKPNRKPKIVGFVLGVIPAILYWSYAHNDCAIWVVRKCTLQDYISGFGALIILICFILWAVTAGLIVLIFKIVNYFQSKNKV